MKNSQNHEFVKFIIVSSVCAKLVLEGRGATPEEASARFPPYSEVRSLCSVRGPEGDVIADL